MNFPSELKYTKSHEWVKIDGDTATVGISDHAQSEMGDVVYVELPEVGRALQKQESFGTIESVKTVSDIYAPVAGEVVEANPALVAQSELLNTSPYEEGWLVKIKMSDPQDANSLMDSETYQASLDD